MGLVVCWPRTQWTDGDEMKRQHGRFERNEQMFYPRRGTWLNVYSAQWVWMRKHLGGFRKFETIVCRGRFANDSARQTMMRFDVNIWRSLNTINVRHITPAQNHPLLIWYFHCVQSLFNPRTTSLEPFADHGATQSSPPRSHPRIQTSVYFYATKVQTQKRLTSSHQNCSTWAVNIH